LLANYHVRVKIANGFGALRPLREPALHETNCASRIKDGKEHCYWNIVESKRCAGGKVVQRQVLYLGEINDSQREAWCRVIEAFDEKTQQRTQLALFPAQAEARSSMLWTICWTVVTSVVLPAKIS
jgi:hypothetical protein